jgi:hypothetical protein
MTHKTYQKAFTGIVLAIALSLASTVAKASTGNSDDGLLLGKTSLSGLSGQDLVSGNLAVDLLASPVEPSISLSTDVRFSDRQREHIAAARVGGPNSRPTQRAHTERSTASTEPRSQVAQTTDSTFAPLSPEQIRQQLLIDPNLSVADLLARPQSAPSSSFLTPSAYGADWGDGYVGLSGSTVDNANDYDGSASFGFGLGDAVNNVGVELGVGIISLDGFAEDGVVGFKLHRVFPEANNLGVALGWTNPIKWGAAQQDEDTYYGVVTQQFDLQPNRSNTMPLTVSLGVGTGAFRSTGAIAAGDNSPNLFGSVGLRVIPKVSVISSWTGSALGLGFSTAPFDAPFVVTAGVADLTDNTAGGTQFVGSLGYSFQF